MKTLPLLLFVAFCSSCLCAQSEDSIAVERACLHYIEGFYEGDTAKLIQCLSPALHKYGYYKDKSGQYVGEAMRYDDAIAYAKRVLEKKRFAKSDAPKSVTVLDVQERIACAKVVAWWGLDYILLAKTAAGWKIDQVLWQGPLTTIVR